MANERELLGKLFHVVDHDGDGVVDQSEILAFLGHLYHDHQYCTLQSVTKEHSEEAFASYLFLKWQQPFCCAAPTSPVAHLVAGRSTASRRR